MNTEVTFFFNGKRQGDFTLKIIPRVGDIVTLGNAKERRVIAVKHLISSAHLIGITLEE